MENDRVMYKDFARLAELIASGRLAEGLRQAAQLQRPDLAILVSLTTSIGRNHSMRRAAAMGAGPGVGTT